MKPALKKYLETHSYEEYEALLTKCKNEIEDCIVATSESESVDCELTDLPVYITGMVYNKFHEETDKLGEYYRTQEFCYRSVFDGEIYYEEELLTPYMFEYNW